MWNVTWWGCFKAAPGRKGEAAWKKDIPGQAVQGKPSRGLSSHYFWSLMLPGRGQA